MAEGFAKAYGAQVLEACSAGLAPANLVAPETRKVMMEKNIDLSEHFPKDVRLARPQLMDVVVNLSGFPLPPGDWKDVREWPVADPVGKPEKFHREVRDDIENRVMELVLELRSRRPGVVPAPASVTRVRFGRTRP